MPEGTVLFVCTGNLYRSPAAAAVLRAELAERDCDFAVGSAGLGRGGLVAPARLVRVMRRHGYDVSDHTSAALSADMLADSAVVLCMENRQLQAVLDVLPRARPWTWLLFDLLERAHDGGGRGPETALASWLAELDATRPEAELVRARSTFDVPDPARGSPLTLPRVVARLKAGVHELVELVLCPGAR